ncbi:hypothetical protein RIR_jg18185.t2 [Rhizophagus irregularis DAOM 181602=DAOM 197198]|nr:hypothetical protein RIR_jg18185.t2 [Rhizophagus irregularis DAOM 181602=DAOM 197198]
MKTNIKYSKITIVIFSPIHATFKRFFTANWLFEERLKCFKHFGLGSLPVNSSAWTFSRISVWSLSRISVWTFSRISIWTLSRNRLMVF